MAINDSQKVDFLWKKLIYGQSSTSTTAKQAANETIPSPVIVDSRNVWSEAASIPATPPASDTSVIEVLTGANAVVFVPDPTVANDRTWIAVSDVNGDPADPANRLGNWIPASFGPDYLVKVYSDQTVAPGNSLNLLAANNEWVFDYASGVLQFINNIPPAGTGIIVEGYRYIGEVGGTGSSGGGTGGTPIFTELPADGDFDAPRVTGGKSPAVTGWTTNTKIVDAVDSLNEILGLLLPDGPDDLSTKTLSFPNTRPNGALYYADGYTDNTGSGPAAGSPAANRSTNSASSALVTSFGSGNSGVLSATLNGSSIDSIPLTGGDDTGTSANGFITITANDDFPQQTPGFFQDLSARIANITTLGLNNAVLEHSETGTTNTADFLVDTVGDTVTVSGVSVTEGSTINTSLSSGVPHYDAGSVLLVSASATNLSTQTYLQKGIFVGSISGSVASTQAGAGDYGLPDPLVVNYASGSITDMPLTISGNHHRSSTISVSAHNPDKDGSSSFGSTVLVMSGNPTSPVKELNIPVRSSLGSIPSGASTNGYRVNTSDFSAWDSSTLVASDEATVVGGVMRHDNTDYTSGYLPAGPDYSSKAAVQYFTVEFRRSAVSLFDIQVTGTYSGLEVQIPGVAGWWDMFQLYGGAGVPTAGCALGSVATGSSGTFRATFGTETSTNATDNKIYVRFRMEANDSITGIEIK
tara:strand:+ start:110485 stop:112575 length:2091 start_codon:yes stop_codon:yes gene_type:complete